MFIRQFKLKNNNKKKFLKLKNILRFLKFVQFFLKILKQKQQNKKQLNLSFKFVKKFKYKFIFKKILNTYKPFFLIIKKKKQKNFYNKYLNFIQILKIFKQLTIIKLNFFFQYYNYFNFFNSKFYQKKKLFLNYILSISTSKRNFFFHFLNKSNFIYQPKIFLFPLNTSTLNISIQNLILKKKLNLKKKIKFNFFSFNFILTFFFNLILLNIFTSNNNLEQKTSFFFNNLIQIFQNFQINSKKIDKKKITTWLFHQIQFKQKKFFFNQIFLLIFFLKKFFIFWPFYEHKFFSGGILLKKAKGLIMLKKNSVSHIYNIIQQIQNYIFFQIKNEFLNIKEIQISLYFQSYFKFFFKPFKQFIRFLKPKKSKFSLNYYYQKKKQKNQFKLYQRNFKFFKKLILKKSKLIVYFKLFSKLFKQKKNIKKFWRIQKWYTLLLNGKLTKKLLFLNYFLNKNKKKQLYRPLIFKIYDLMPKTHNGLRLKNQAIK